MDDKGQVMPPERFSLYTVFPTSLFFRHDIKDDAKMLYGLLSCMADCYGYAFPRNATLQKYLGGVSEDTVSRKLRHLEQAGAIRIEGGDGGRGIRKIFIVGIDFANLRNSAEVEGDNLRNSAEGIQYMNKKKKSNKISDADIGAWISPWAANLGYSMELTTPLIGDFLAFAENRKAKGKPFLTIRAVSMQANKLVSLLPEHLKVAENPASKARSKKLVPDPDKPEAIARMRYMLRSSISHNWEEVYGIDERTEREFWLWSAEELGILKPSVNEDYF